MQSTVTGNKNAPLLSWDIFMEHYHGLSLQTDQVARDLQMLQHFALKHQWASRFTFTPHLQQTNSAIVITDPGQQIVWVSHNFENMTGYRPEETIGRRPSFLQGTATDRESLATVRESITRQVPVLEQVIINYRKTGEMYLCQVDIHPVRNFAGELTHFIAFEREVAA